MLNRCFLSLWVVALAGVASAEEAAYERPPIGYLSASGHDPVATLMGRIDAGGVRLQWDDKAAYLPALLKALNIPVSSQVLVFSKTSFQRDLIDPQRPRALYFNDDVYVGYVPGGNVIELASTDPQNGPMYFTLDQGKRGGGTAPSFTRQTDACLQCHVSSATNEMPGHLLRSVFPDADGLPILSAGTFRTNPTSPLKQRWGGWYVTGTSGTQVHMGNVVSADRENPDKTDFTAGTNVRDLSSRLDTSQYLTPHSDIVALMVLEHQTYVHNLITRASYLTRITMHDAAEMNKALGRPVDFRSDSTTSRIKNAVEPLLKGILCSEEAALTGAIEGTSGFAKDFSVRGPRDAKGRSLRDLDLKTRLLKYPCSYLIYSASFDALPPEALERFYQRLFDVLSGKDQSKEYAHLSSADRKAILDILVATKKGLPPYFSQSR